MTNQHRHKRYVPPTQWPKPKWAIAGDFEDGFTVIPFQEGLSPAWTAFTSREEVEHLRDFIIN